MLAADNSAKDARVVVCDHVSIEVHPVDSMTCSIRTEAGGRGLGRHAESTYSLSRVPFSYSLTTFVTGCTLHFWSFDLMRY